MTAQVQTLDQGRAGQRFRLHDKLSALIRGEGPECSKVISCGASPALDLRVLCDISWEQQPDIFSIALIPRLMCSMLFLIQRQTWSRLQYGERQSVPGLHLGGYYTPKVIRAAVTSMVIPWKPQRSYLWLSVKLLVIGYSI